MITHLPLFSTILTSRATARAKSDSVEEVLAVFHKSKSKIPQVVIQLLLVFRLEKDDLVSKRVERLDIFFFKVNVFQDIRFRRVVDNRYKHGKVHGEMADETLCQDQPSGLPNSRTPSSTAGGLPLRRGSLRR